MPERSFVQAKRDQRNKEQTYWLCRIGAHRMPRTMFVVQYGQRVGLCGNCLATRCNRKQNGGLDIASYWVRDRPVEQIEQSGTKE